MKILKVDDYAMKQVESNHSKTEPWKWSCSWIIKFSHCLNFRYRKLFFQFKLKMAVHVACKKENIWTTFETFLRRVNFILMFFQEIPSLLSMGKPFPGDLENWNVKKISKLMFGQNIFPYFDPCIYFSKKNPRFFRFVTLLLENKLLPLQILQNCVTPFVGGNYNVRNQGQWKFQHWRYFHMFFL